MPITAKPKAVQTSTTESPIASVKTSTIPSETDEKTTTTTSKVIINTCNQNPCNNNGICLVNFQLNTNTCFVASHIKVLFKIKNLVK